LALLNISIIKIKFDIFYYPKIYLMRNKDYIFCIFTKNTDSAFTFYKNYIESLINKYGKFTIINFYRYSKTKVKNKPNENILRKKFKNKINFFYPKNKYEFIDFIENKHLIAIDSLGRNFKDFKLRYLINKKNISLILLINLGYLSNESIGQLKLSIKNTFYLYYNTMNKIFYRILILLNIFPKTVLYFDSRKKVVDKFRNNKTRKLLQKFSTLSFLKNYLNIHRINSNTYENLLKAKKIKKNNKIIFVDGNYKHSDIIKREKLNLDKIKIEYFKILVRKFTTLEKIFKKKVEICLHPTSDLKIYKKYLKNFKISKGKTTEKVLGSYMVTIHESSVIIDALMSNKMILIFETNILGNYLLNKMLMYKHLLKIPSINIHSKKTLSKNDILKNYKKTKKYRDKYISENLIYDNNTFASTKFTKIINNFIENNKRHSV